MKFKFYGSAYAKDGHVRSDCIVKEFDSSDEAYHYLIEKDAVLFDYPYIGFKPVRFEGIIDNNE